MQVQPVSADPILCVFAGARTCYRLFFYMKAAFGMFLKHIPQVHSYVSLCLSKKDLFLR